MNNSNNILTELKTLSPLLAGIEKNNVFSVPNGYFENLSIEIITILNKEKNNQQIVTSTKPLHADIPIDYFDSLANNILDKIKNQESLNAVEEIKNISPTLTSIQLINVFEAPENYFDNFSDEIIKQIQVQNAKVFVINKRRNIFKYAIAAAIVGIMALGIFKFIPQQYSSNPLPQYVIDGKKIENIDEELSKISDAEIVQYLQNNGEDMDVANLIDDNELPNETDYFYNEKTLDNYLFENDAESLKN